MIYISIGLVITICGFIFLVTGVKKKWREVINGSIVLTGVGIFIFIAGIIALGSRG